MMQAATIGPRADGVKESKRIASPPVKCKYGFIDIVCPDETESAAASAGDEEVES